MPPPVDMTPFCNMRVLLKKEGKSWVAICLDYVIAVQAKTIDEAKSSLIRIMVLNMVTSINEGEPPLSNKTPAPEDLRKLWDKAKPEHTWFLTITGAIPSFRGVYKPRYMN